MCVDIIITNGYTLCEYIYNGGGWYGECGGGGGSKKPPYGVRGVIIC